LNVEHKRFRFGEAGRLNNDNFRRNFLDNLGNCCLEFTKQRAANAAAAELCDPHVFAFDHFGIDCHLAKFIHHDGNPGRACGQDVAEQRRFAAAEWAGH
jgi:hypothetical protein